MSAPVTERARAATRARTATIPTQRGASADPAAGRSAAPSALAPGRRSAQQKAYARRDDRLRRIVGGRPIRSAAPAGRPQFVLLIMVLLAVGLVATLWLSTAAAADSYRLEEATAEAGVLSEQAERLHREVAVLASAPELARRASVLGMVPVQDPARLVVAPEGGVEVVGEPRAAVAPPRPAPPAATPPPAEQRGAPAEGATPDAATPDTSTPDTTGPDASTPDASTPDSSTPDSSTPDSTTRSDADQAQLAAGADADRRAATGGGAADAAPGAYAEGRPGAGDQAGPRDPVDAGRAGGDGTGNG